MTDLINLNAEQCQKWLNNINIHPITGKELDIANNLPLYRKLSKQCLMHDIVVDKNVVKDKSQKINDKLITVFNNLIDMKQVEYDEMPRALTPELKKKKQALRFGKIAMIKVIDILKNMETEITDIKQLEGVSGIGSGSQKRIKEFLETGKLAELEEYDKMIEKRQANKQIVDELKRVHGIGEVNAIKLVEEGIKSVSDLKKAHKNGTVKLNANVIVGLKFYDDLIERIPRNEMDKFNKLLNKKAKEIDSKLNLILAGSYRRGAKSSGDLDILLSHEDIKTNEDLKNNDNYMNIYLEKIKNMIVGSLSSGDTKFMGVIKYTPIDKARRIDIRYLPMESYYTALLYFTGSGNFNILMRNHAIDKGYKLSEYHLYKVHKEDGKVLEKPIKINSEKHIFDIIKMEYLEPEDREMGKGY